MKSVSAREWEILATVRRTMYGELKDIRVPPGPAEREARTTGPENKLLDLLRDHAFIDKIVVHQGQPSYAEIETEQHGIKVVQKHKLN